MGAIDAVQPASTPGSALRALSAWVVDARAWKRIVYLVSALPLGVAYFAVIVGGLSSGLGVAIMTFGLPLVVMMWVWRLMARFERLLASRLLGVELPDPYRPAEGGWFARMLSRVGDPVLQKMLATSLVGGLSSLFTAYLNGQLAASRKQFIDYCVNMLFTTAAPYVPPPEQGKSQ